MLSCLDRYWVEARDGGLEKGGDGDEDAPANTPAQSPRKERER